MHGFCFHYSVSVFGYKLLGQRNAYVYYIAYSISNVYALKRTVFLLLCCFFFLSAICISSSQVNVQHYLGKQDLHNTPCSVEEYLLV